MKAGKKKTNDNPHEDLFFLLLSLLLLLPTCSLTPFKPFFLIISKLVESISNKPVVAMILKGIGVVNASRLMIGATNPLLATPGTIRGDYA